MPLWVLYVSVEIYVVLLYLYQFEYVKATHNSTLTLHITLAINLTLSFFKVHLGLQEYDVPFDPNTDLAQRFNFYGFMTVDDVYVGTGEGKTSLLPWIFCAILATFAEYSPQLGTKRFQTATYVRKDGVAICYLFAPAKVTSKDSYNDVSMKYAVSGAGIIESYGFIIVSTLALLSGTCRPTVASLFYGFFAFVTAFSHKKTLYDWWRCVLFLLTFHLGAIYSVLLIGAYVEHGQWSSAPWTHFSQDYQVWYGFTIDDLSLLYLDFFTLLAAASQMRLLSFMTEDQR